MEKHGIFAPMKNFWCGLTDGWRSRGMHVLLDATDNSVTLSERLFGHMKAHACGDSARVLVFFIPDDGCYGFMVNPSLETETQLCDIQVNGKYGCVGFESLCPSVGKMLYDYGLPHDARCRVSVLPEKTGSGAVYYRLVRKVRHE